jgi:hypothetical protein
MESCPQCRAEALELRGRISSYSFAMRSQAERAQRSHMSRAVAPRKTLLLHRMRWAGAGVLALLLAAQTAWLMKPRPAAPATTPQPTTAVVAPPSAAATTPETQPAASSATQPATQLSDDELLEAVNNDLSREVPLALAPVSAITTARNRIAAASPGANATGNTSGSK